MQLRNEMTQERQRAVPARKNHSPQANFQLEGLWLHVLRGTWVAFMLAQLVIIILSLLASRTYGLTICPFPGACAVTPATAQALHRLGMAPSSYLTYNLVLALFQSLVLLSVGGLIFWHKSSEPICLAASFVFVSLGLWPFFTNSTYPLAVVSGYIAALFWLGGQ
ncbi:MAG: hypothetical protein E6I97_21050 [Chloroflexi bacterium]|nr:MAG: hypothetical protein E6I97_21050 [Chloroflexota bacterium]